MNIWQHDLKELLQAIRLGHALPAQLAHSPHYPTEQALEVYRNGYRGNLQGALLMIYPVVAQIVGEDFFKYMARKYIQTHPSRSGNLHDYGSRMADFISTFQPARHLQYLSDVATLEWACHKAYYAADVLPFDYSTLRNIDAEEYGNLIGLCHPACDLIFSLYPIVDIWHAHQSDTTKNFNVGLARGGCCALVSRTHNNEVQVSTLPPASGDWLHQVKIGSTLGVATSQVLAKYPEFNLAETLTHFINQQILISLFLLQEPSNVITQ